MTNQKKQRLTDEELQTLNTLLAKLSGDGADLPWPLFRFITEVAATTNIDLLVRDPKKGFLLAWRDDAFGVGWHVPGSIIRHREEITHRIAACAADEFGCKVDTGKGPVALIQIFDDRGHSVSLCFQGSLRGEPTMRVLVEGEAPEPGDLRWFQTLPAAPYPSHLVYSDVLLALNRGELGEGLRMFTQHIGSRDASQTSPEGQIAADTSLT